MSSYGQHRCVKNTSKDNSKIVHHSLLVDDVREGVLLFPAFCNHHSFSIPSPRCAVFVGVVSLEGIAFPAFDWI